MARRSVGAGETDQAAEYEVLDRTAGRKMSQSISTICSNKTSDRGHHTGVTSQEPVRNPGPCHAVGKVCIFRGENMQNRQPTRACCPNPPGTCWRKPATAEEQPRPSWSWRRSHNDVGCSTCVPLTLRVFMSVSGTIDVESTGHDLLPEPALMLSEQVQLGF